MLAGRPEIELIGDRLMTDHAGFPRWAGYRGDQGIRETMIGLSDHVEARVGAIVKS